MPIKVKSTLLGTNDSDNTVVVAHYLFPLLTTDSF